MEPALVGQVKWLFQSLFESCWFEMVEIILGKIDSDLSAWFVRSSRHQKPRVWVLSSIASRSNLSRHSIYIYHTCFSYQQPDQTQPQCCCYPRPFVLQCFRMHLPSSPSHQCHAPCHCTWSLIVPSQHADVIGRGRGYEPHSVDVKLFPHVFNLQHPHLRI